VVAHLSELRQALGRGARRAGEAAVLVLLRGLRLVVLATAVAIRLPALRRGADVGALPALGRVREVRAARPSAGIMRL
jgi:hypothetical protein